MDTYVLKVPNLCPAQLFRRVQRGYSHKRGTAYGFKSKPEAGLGCMMIYKGYVKDEQDGGYLHQRCMDALSYGSNKTIFLVAIETKMKMRQSLKSSREDTVTDRRIYMEYLHSAKLRLY